MAIPSSPATLLRLLLLLICLGTIWAAAATSHPIRDDASVTLRPLSQLRNIIDTLIGTGDSAGLSDTDLSLLFPSSFTIFIPTDAALPSLTFLSDTDPSLIRYHIVPQKLPFFDLLQLKIGDRIPTLLANETIVITNNTQSNFRVDGSLISQPDLYNRDAIAVHGIDSFLDSSIYGGSYTASVASPPPLQQLSVMVLAIFVIFAFKIQ